MSHPSDTPAPSTPYPSRIPLAHTPTPMEPLKRLSGKLGVEIYVKRDDLTGAELTGNKVRKLEFVLADALERGADTVLTCGGAQSNHCRATAVAAAKVGLRCRLLLRTFDPSSPPPPEGNLLLDRIMGAEILWMTPEEYRRRDEFFEREASSLRKQGRKPYIIPEGASNALGAWGYIRAAEEVAHDLSGLSDHGHRQTTMIHATGSGGTTAGLIIGKRLFDLNVRVVGVNVCDDKDYFVKVIGEICEQTISQYRLDLAFSRDRDIEIVDGYVGRGYALSRPEELELIRDVAREEGIFLDPVYTGKAFFGMVKELERNPKCFGERIIFLHTGGIFGLFPKAAEMAAVLS
jgi:D-cysteine desulfhydrase